VEGPKFCLFSVVLPVRCISSTSPRFYFRRHASCFLPLAAILESLNIYFFNLHLNVLLHLPCLQALMSCLQFNTDYKDAFIWVLLFELLSFSFTEFQFD
jgi:hypothetical protein